MDKVIEQSADQDKDTMEKDEKWEPSPEVFQAYLDREAEHACFNIKHLLKSGGHRKVSYNLKGLKDSTLHSVFTLEQALSHLVAECVVMENRGDYSLLA